MPPTAFELEVRSLTRWLHDTVPEARILLYTMPGNFKRPAFFIEAPRATQDSVLPGARMRQAVANVTYFGSLDTDEGGGQPWLPFVMSGRLEAALAENRHRIPRLDESGAQVGVLRITGFEWSQNSTSDTDMALTFRWQVLVWDHRPELDGETLEIINITQNQ